MDKEMDNMRKAAAIIAVISAMAAMPLVAADIPDYVPTISVSGSAEVKVEPDTASFTITATFIEETSAEAMEKASAMIGSAIDILGSGFGVEDDDLTTAYISVAPEYRWVDDEQVLAGQKAVQRVDVKLRDLSLIGDVYTSLMALDGISVSDVSMDKSDKSAEYREARMAAVRDAYAEASAYAEAAGAKVGRVLSISDGSSYAAPLYRSANLMMAAAEAMPAKDAASYYAGDITVSASVSIIYEIIQ